MKKILVTLMMVFGLSVAAFADTWEDVYEKPC